MSITDFIAFDDPMMLATVDALRRDLALEGFLYRYQGDDGLPGQDATFLACTLWLAAAFGCDRVNTSVRPPVT